MHYLSYHKKSDGSRTTGKRVITFSHITKKYANGHTALNQISVSIHAGEMVFLHGHSGAGKTTLLKLIAKIESPSRGKITVGNLDLTHLKPHQVPFYRRKLGFISQNPQLLNSYTVFENVALPLKIAGYDRIDCARRARAALEHVGLLHKEHCFPNTLSAGEQQRVGIARAVVHKPHFLLADEPTGNLDPALSLEIMKLFVRFNQAGVTVLIASHDTELLEQFSHRKILLSEGRLVPLAKIPDFHKKSGSHKEAEYA